ncbi:MAG: hypothetical protein EOM67_15270 [Spirochaetia bacterium]|nr:hypothetical protein [Spirochaetia bacterium]
MKWVMLVLVVMLSGCATKVEYVDRPVEVKVPVKCKLEMPKKPDVTIDVDGLRAVLTYTELLECTLKKCRGEACK